MIRMCSDFSLFNRREKREEKEERETEKKRGIEREREGARTVSGIRLSRC